MTSLKVINRKQIGDFLLEQISKKWYRIIYTERPDHDILMTGSAVTKDFDIDFTFVFARLHLTHHSATFKTLSTDEIILILNRPMVHGVDGFIDDFYKKADIVDSKAIISFEDLNAEGGLVFEASTIRISLNSTSTDRIQPIFYIKRLD